MEAMSKQMKMMQEQMEILQAEKQAEQAQRQAEEDPNDEGSPIEDSSDEQPTRDSPYTSDKDGDSEDDQVIHNGKKTT